MKLPAKLPSFADFVLYLHSEDGQFPSIDFFLDDPTITVILNNYTARDRRSESIKAFADRMKSHIQKSHFDTQNPNHWFRDYSINWSENNIGEGEAISSFSTIKLYRHFSTGQWSKQTIEDIHRETSQIYITPKFWEGILI